MILRKIFCANKIKKDGFVIKTQKLLIYLIYVSLFFLGMALYKAEYLIIPKIFSYKNILFSFSLLFCGFVLEAQAWKKNLNIMGFSVGFSDSLISLGLFVFGKYIPGKVWVLAGRATYLAAKKNYSKKDIAVVALINQMLSMWVGLWLGFLGLIFIEKMGGYSDIVLLLIFFLTAFLFTKLPGKVFNYFYHLLFKKQIQFQYISLQQILMVLPWYFARWLVLSLAFYFLILGLTNTVIPFYAALGFAFAGNLALIFILFPGGLGVREGMLFGFLVLCNFSVEIATTISVVSRLWFLIGEIFIFGCAVLLEKKLIGGTKNSTF